MGTLAKPSLHEIAAMPFPESVKAMRKHYVKDWGKPIPEGGEKRKFKVRLTITTSECDAFTVDAFSEDEAEEAAIELADKQYGSDAEIDVDDVEEVSE